ncbi:MAG: response regulator [Proteobacteria bacterium]|nr:response regulator [Pseudomonadota bacterium]
MNKILIVDDEKAIRDVLSDTLSFLGYEVTVASNGHEGFSLFLNNSFELVFTDMHMPGMDGWTLARRIKDKSPNTPVVLITGSEKETVMKRFKGSFVDTVIFKPLSLEDIQKTVQGFLHTRQWTRGSAPSVSDSVSSQRYMKAEEQ